MKQILTLLFAAVCASGVASGQSVRHPAEPDMVQVQGGTFTMGCTGEQGDACTDEEKPSHSVTVDSFSIGKYEVTQAQWESVMGNNPSYFKRGGNYPVEQVNWADVQEFIERLNRATGKNYRLPTEAEWEFAARGGNKSQGYKYSGSHSPNNAVWYNGNSGEHPHPVGTKQPNELGIYDMSGNVGEWCSDWFDTYPAHSQSTHAGAAQRIIRGGSWRSHAAFCRISYRGYDPPSYRHSFVGFRLALP